MAKFTHSRFLFTNVDGTPMHFHMPPCSERRKLTPYIEHGGGILSVKYSNKEDVIRLVPPGTKVTCEGFVKSSYIMDCVEQNRVLDIDDYRLPANAVYESDDDSFLSDDVHGPFIIKGRLKDKCGRKKYLLSEDMNIIRYLINEHAADEVRGNEIWKKMELLKITTHTWQSMRDRYLKTILPHIGSYNLTHRQKAILTGNTFEPESNDKQITSPSPKQKQVDNNDELNDGPLQADTASEEPSSEQVRRTSPRKQTPTKCSSPSKGDLCMANGDEQRTGEKSLQLHRRLEDVTDNKSVLLANDHPSAHSVKSVTSSADSCAKTSHKRDINKLTRHSGQVTCISESSHDDDDDDDDRRMLTRQKRKHDDGEDTIKEQNKDEMPSIGQRVRQAASSNNKRHGKACRTKKRAIQFQALETVEEWLNLSRPEMMDALYRVNGVLDDAVHWIIHGTRQNGRPTWTEAADKLVMKGSSQATEKLLKSYTLDEINTRKIFISQNT